MEAATAGAVIKEFSRAPFGIAGSIEQPSMDEVKATPSLWQADLTDAIKYGGDLTRAALSAMNIRGDRKHVIVDTKVHMLAPGQCPALPGWHTDGTPRLPETIGEAIEKIGVDQIDLLHPQNKGLPVIEAQELLESPRFHLLVTGEGCLTEFINEPVELVIPAKPSRDLYKMITKQARGKVTHGKVAPIEIPSCTSVEWDWWALHNAKIAEKVEWRFLIRVTESDYNEPQTDLRKIVRVQNQVYAPLDSGW